MTTKFGAVTVGTRLEGCAGKPRAAEDAAASHFRNDRANSHAPREAQRPVEPARRAIPVPDSPSGKPEPLIAECLVAQEPRQMRGELGTWGLYATGCSPTPPAATAFQKEAAMKRDVWPFDQPTTLALGAQVIFWLGVLAGWMGDKL